MVWHTVFYAKVDKAKDNLELLQQNLAAVVQEEADAQAEYDDAAEEQHKSRPGGEEAYMELAGLNPEALPMAVKCGIAPAMVASTSGNYWVRKARTS